MADIFSRASAAWSRMDAYRAERARCKRYVYGEQWADLVRVGENWVSEKELMSRNGETPLTNNILRRIIRNVVGLYRAQYKVPLLNKRDTVLKGNQLREANRQRQRWFAENRMEELSPRLLEEFLISGLVAVKVEGRRIIPITPDNFFFHSDGYDPRSSDIDLIGEVHRVSFGTLLEKFCETADDYRRIARTYAGLAGTADGCRLTEVWHRETRVFAMLHDEETATLRIVPMESSVFSLQPSEVRNLDSGLWNMDSDHSRLKTQDLRLMTKTGWRRSWYAPDGTLLRQSEIMDSHPYTFKAYPFLDGEIHSYVSDIIDQQRFVNRLITLYDLIMRSSAKGVLLFPDECIPAGMDLQDVAEEWSQFNGVIPYRARPGVPMPTQVSANSTNIGIAELLKIEMQMLEDISGVSPTMQGKLVANATSGTLFAQQNEAAQTSLLDIIRSFTDFLSQLSDKLSAVSCQTY